ncbi:MAG TPA: aldehyde dehydrogenase family protein [Candidatus Binatia bacterium]|nr:aldehyde dehydrogenase family protein [Candidatus Binatia bacterium]
MAARLEVRSPYDQQVVCALDWDDDAAVERKIAAARASWDRWRRTPLRGRMRVVGAGLERFRVAGEDVAEEISCQMGKPIAQARREVATFLERADWALAAAEKALAPDVLPEERGLRRRIEHEPLGVVLDIAAWNYPLLVPVNVIVPALLAGNVVLLKHSERTPLTGRAIARAFADLGDLALVNDVLVPPAETARLIRDPRVAHVAFTGSVRTGRAVYQVAAERFIDAGLELGGKDPAYVAADADLAYAAENVVDGACYNAGQSCCAVERVYVHARVADEFLERARAVLERYRLGDPLDESTTLGPLAIRHNLDVVEAQVEDAVRTGARVLLGGRRVEGSAGNFMPPTLVANVPNDTSLMQEETFAPVVPVLAVSGDDEALARMRETRFGLTASVWTRDAERAERMARDLDAGTIFQNRCDYIDPALPWTGCGESGKGSTMSRYGFLGLTRRKAIHFRTIT